MTEIINTKLNINKLTVSSILLALGIVLSFVVIYRMPYGGDITAVSMLPIALISIKYGIKQGIVTAFLFSIFQFFYGFFALTAFLHTFKAVIICVMFDYILPYTFLGFAGIFRKHGYFGCLVGLFSVLFVKFVFHFISGIMIWGQFAPDDTTTFMYSLIYNGGYMGVETLITMIVAGILFKFPQITNFLKGEK